MKYMVALDGSDHSAKALALSYRFVKEDDTLMLLTGANWNPSKLREFFDESGLANAKTNLQKQCDDLIAAKLAEAKQHVRLDCEGQLQQIQASNNSANHDVVLLASHTLGSQRHWQGRVRSAPRRHLRASRA